MTTNKIMTQCVLFRACDLIRFNTVNPNIRILAEHAGVRLTWLRTRKDWFSCHTAYLPATFKSHIVKH